MVGIPAMAVPWVGAASVAVQVAARAGAAQAAVREERAAVRAARARQEAAAVPRAAARFPHTCPERHQPTHSQSNRQRSSRRSLLAVRTHLAKLTKGLPHTPTSKSES